MNKNELKNGIKILTKSGLPNMPEFDRDTLYVWYLFLGEYSYKDFILAIMITISRNRFFPTISELLKLMLNQKIYPNKYTIWEEFKIKDKNELNPLIKKAFKIAGIDRYYLKDVTSDTAQRFLRPKVEKIYQQLIDELNDIKQLNRIEKVIKRIDYTKLELRLDAKT